MRHQRIVGPSAGEGAAAPPPPPPPPPHVVVDGATDRRRRVIEALEAETPMRLGLEGLALILAFLVLFKLAALFFMAPAPQPGLYFSPLTRQQIDEVTR